MNFYDEKSLFRQLYKKPVCFCLGENSISFMKEVLKSRKKTSYEINWHIREIFSESALTSFCDEIDNKYLVIEKNNY